MKTGLIFDMDGTLWDSSENVAKAWNEKINQLGLDRPVSEQYLNYISDVLHGDFGTSYMYNQPVVGLILQRVPSTLQITLTSLILALIIGTAVGMFSALHQYSAFDYLFMILALIGVSMPIFWLGMMLVSKFSIELDLLPVL